MTASATPDIDTLLRELREAVEAANMTYLGDEEEIRLSAMSGLERRVKLYRALAARAPAKVAA